MRGRKQDILMVNNRKKARSLLDRMKGKSPAFVCVGGATETAEISGISTAGKEPELTCYTPAGDLEILFHGETKSIETLPVTPRGVPTPALISLSALELGGIAPLAVNAGMKVSPSVPFMEIGGKPGKNIREKNPVLNPRDVFFNAKLVGDAIGRIVDYLIVGETIPGGTTTALGVLKAMGVDAESKMSSSMPKNPHNLKNGVVSEGLKSSGLSVGDLRGSPFKAISKMGDPVIPAFAGLAAGSSEHVPTILAGGTQMAAILKVLEKIEPKIIRNVFLGTTSWIIHDKDSDLKGLINQISNVPILAADLDFSESKFEGLRAYQDGYVKEGVGAGGAAIGAMLKSDVIDAQALLERVEKYYEILVKQDEF